MLQFTHFRLSIRILVGLAHLPDSIANLCEDTLNLLIAWIHLQTLIFSKYGWNWNCMPVLWKFALDELFILSCQFCIKISLSLCFKTDRKVSTFPTPCANQTSRNPNDANKLRTSDAQFALFGNSSISLIIILYIILIYLFPGVCKILNQYLIIMKDRFVA